MNLSREGASYGILIGGIVGGILCKSFGTLATLGGMIAGLFVGGLLGWLYAGLVIFLIPRVSAVWNTVCIRPSLETTKAEETITQNTARFSIGFALISSTMIAFREAWYHGLILAAILAVVIAIVAIAAGKCVRSKNKVLYFKLFDLEKIADTHKLLRYRRVMLWIVQLCVFTGITMASGLALGLAFGFHTAEIILLVIFSVISLSTMIPFLFCFVWIGEIETILKKRHIPFDNPISNRVGIWALKMMFWFALLVLLPILVRKLTGQTP